MRPFKPLVVENFLLRILFDGLSNLLVRHFLESIPVGLPFRLFDFTRCDGGTVVAHRLVLVLREQSDCSPAPS